jgi:NifU-like protein
VVVRFLGMCSGCPSSQATLNNLVETSLKEKVDPDLKVREG